MFDVLIKEKHWGDFSISDKASKEVLSIPVNLFLTNDKIDKIIFILQKNFLWFDLM